MSSVRSQQAVASHHIHTLTADVMLAHQEEVAAAEAQRERWEKRAVAMASLEAVIEAVSAPDADPTASSNAVQQARVHYLPVISVDIL